MLLGSLFDGIGGWPLAAVHYGITPIWSSEIEPFPQAVTAKWFPNMRQLGDITKIDGSKITPVDIITIGSPCQDLSIAGRREGLNGQRSGLFLRAIDIVRQMRIATDGKCPRFIVWENVPGAFSSNKGLDFKSVLEEIGQVKIPIPEHGKWSKSGVVELPKCQIAWRVLDAQYWGVPQRRKRIFLVADFTGRCAAEILFKPESLPRDTTKSTGTEQGTAANPETGIRIASAFIPKQGNKARGIGYRDNCSPTLGTDCNVAIAFNSNAGVLDNNPIENEMTPTMRTATRLAVFENHPNDSRVNGPLNVCTTVNSRYGTGGGNIPLVLDDQGGQSINIGNGLVPTLSSLTHGNLPCVIDKAFSLETFHCTEFKEQASTLKARDYKDPQCVLKSSMVRRLTPTECERLQGLEDGYTDVPCKGKPASDSARYKAIGNGMAQPCADYIMAGISEVLRRDKHD